MGGGEEKASGGARLTASEALFGIQGKNRHPDGPSSCCKAALISAVEQKKNASAGLGLIQMRLGNKGSGSEIRRHAAPNVRL